MQNNAQAPNEHRQGDLRHEAGCRWREATSKYLHAAEMRLQESMKRFDAARGEGPQLTSMVNPW